MTEIPHVVNDAAVTRYARRYAEANMTAQVKIVRLEAAFLDESTGELHVGEQFTMYEGKARVYGVSGPMTMNLGEEPQYFSSTYVSIPYDAATTRVDDVVEVIAHKDWTLVGRSFRVMDVESGGQYPAVRRMQVTGIQNSKQWAASEATREHPSSQMPKEWLV